ncbi:serine/threonine-protein kinase H1 homolog [Selaginella moellendorffii]|uniref:serine/threonine-protein kinase H1 homolog n=1 Tax=Selaginella moellendorffii TaxID=88036 RepID=UPI000D1C696D|nr:serine/threonine-protein kinase H1 homolog [Selaginella moellendorffii]|eukprot:XP_024515536.1 serine/threonine-protein kinase H1 homolog [Selaginella moellendorffii]
MMMELCGPSLWHRLIKGGPLGEKEAAKTIQLLAEALKVIHTSGIVHRNLKPKNIFVKLDALAVHDGDFGVATDDPKEMSQYCGTGKYMAPEMTSCKSGHGDSRLQSFYTTDIDMWELLRGYKQSREIELLRAGEFPDGCPLSDEVEDLICGMLAVEPSERLMLDGVLDHPWIVEYCSSKIKKTIHRRRRCGVKRSAPGFSSNLVVKKVRAA